MTKTLIGFSVLIACSVSANLLIKTDAIGAPEQRFLLGILGWKGLFGVMLFGSAFVVYAWLLQWVPLNIAQSFMAAQFIGVILAAAFLLGEPVSAARWLGMGLILAGIVVVGVTAD